MPRSLHQIEQQIDKLQRKANDLQKKEAAGVVQRIKVAIQHYQLSVDDLFGGKSRKANGTKRARALEEPARHTKASKRRAPISVKFRDSEGNTWTGRGSQPRWLVAHLKAGRKVEDFAAKSQ